MNKLLSIIIPSYNGAKFIDTCMNSIVGSTSYFKIKKYYKDIEIILINDGSSDGSIKKFKTIKNDLDKKYGKSFLTVVNKKNGQYGSVINRGLKMAKGKYFKVLDVDDTFNSQALYNTIDIIRAFNPNSGQPDVVFTDHSFEKVGTNNQIIQSLRKWISPYKLIRAKDIKLPRDLITMHSIIYRTDFLRDMNYKQTEGIYYTDSEYSIFPMIRAESFYYISENLYRYYIGRDEQSINIKSMIKNEEHQFKVLKRVLTEVHFDEIKIPEIKAYVSVYVKRLLQWRMMIVILDSRKNTVQSTESTVKILKETNPTSWKKIANEPLTNIVKITKGRGVYMILKIGTWMYSKFKKNIMADWD